MSDAPAPARHMKYPYTLGAKIAQFPYKFYFKNNWIIRYYAFSLVLCIPIFKSISNLGKYLFLLLILEIRRSS